MPNWSPGAWGEFSAPGLAIAMCALLIVALLRGWIVIGKYHREIVDGKDRTIDKQDARATTDAETIHTLSQSLANQIATEDANTRLLSAVREAVGNR